jgi:hypothetical protein
VRFQLGHRSALDEIERAVADEPSAAAPARSEDGSVAVRDPDGQMLAFAGA